MTSGHLRVRCGSALRLSKGEEQPCRGDDRRCGPDPGRQEGREAEGLAPGRPGGAHPQDGGRENDLDPALIDDVIMGTVMQTGEQSVNVGRNAALGAGFPEVPGTTIDRQCGSSQHEVGPLRRPRCDRRRLRRRHRRRSRVDDPHPDGYHHPAGPGLPVRTEDAGALRPRPSPPGALCRDDRREVGNQPRRAGPGQLRVAYASRQGDRRGAVRNPDRSHASDPRTGTKRR